MNEEKKGESIVIKPREPFSDVILPQNADELAKLMEQPLTAIAELITGALAAGPQYWTVMTGHIVQAVLRGRLLQQVSRETTGHDRRIDGTDAKGESSPQLSSLQISFFMARVPKRRGLLPL